MLTKIDSCGESGHGQPWQLVSGSSRGNKGHIGGGSRGRQAVKTPAVVAGETPGQQ